LSSELTKPEDHEDHDSDKSDKSVKNDKFRQLVAASALVPFVCALSQPPDYKVLIYSIFVITYLYNKRPAARNIANLNRIEFALLFVSSALIVQLLDYISYLSIDMAVSANPAMPAQSPVWLSSWLTFNTLVPENFYQFALTAAAMTFMAAVWLYIMKLYAFSYRDGLIVAVASGALISLTGRPQPVEGMLESTIIFASIAGIALTVFRPSGFAVADEDKARLKHPYFRYAAAAVALTVAMRVVIIALRG
jgi:hypothetical protein